MKSVVNASGTGNLQYMSIIRPPYSNSSFTVGNYCLMVLNSQVHQLLSKLLLNYCGVEMKLLSKYCTV